MPIVRTKLFEPGDYGQRRLTAADLVQLHKRGNAFVKRGVQIPIAPRFTEAAGMTHREELVKRTAGNLGFVQAFTLRPSGLYAECDVPDSGEAARIKAARFAAVELEDDFTDGGGAFWPGASIISLALKTDPAPRRRGNAVRLSLNDLKGANMSDATQIDEEVEALRDALKEVRVILPDGCPSVTEEPVQFLRYLTAACLNAAVDPDTDETLGEEEKPTVMLSLARRLGETELVADLESQIEVRRRRKEEAKAKATMRQIDRMMGR
jgi:hypothetical protein